MRAFGLILVLVGVLALAYGGFTYTKAHKILDIGSVEARVDEKKSVPIPPIAGAIALVAGIALVLSNRRRGDAL